MSGITEKKLNNYPEIVSLETTEEIIKQMKSKIFKICLNDGTKGTGFFCKILINNKELKVLITNNHIINLEMEKITISLNNDNEIKVIELNDRIKYTNKEYDITIIEIKEKDKINNYLELDEKIMKKGSNKLYINDTIYIIQYPGGKNLGVSYGILNKIYEDKEYNFNHLCCTEKGSSGSPIINIINNKVIGIHKAAKKNYNIGLFINYAIEDFINKNYIIIGMKMDSNNLKMNIKNDINNNINKETFNNKPQYSLSKNENDIGKNILYNISSNNEDEYNLDFQTNSHEIRDNYFFSPKIGLQNIGLTCYMNATLQCFCHIEKFVNYFKYSQHAISLVKSG